MTCLAFIFLVCIALTNQIPYSERAALLELFQLTNGHNWKENEGWGGHRGSECEWVGIECFDETNGLFPHVASIDLPDNNLRGSVPESVAEIKYLFELNLLGNEIILPLPNKLLTRWDENKIHINVGDPIKIAEEIRLNFYTVTYCRNQMISINSNGDVIYYRELCKGSNRENLEPYCEIRKSKTHDFNMLVKFFQENNFYSREHPEQELVIDGSSSVIAVKGIEGIRTIESQDGVDMPTYWWAYEKIFRGVVEDLKWSNAESLQKCPGY